MKAIRILVTLLVLTGLAAWPFPTSADSICPGLTTPVHPRLFEQITVSSTAIGLTNLASSDKVAVIKIQDEEIRYRDDGTSPTATVGTPISAGDSYVVCGATLGKHKMIRTNSDAVANVHYYN